MKTLLVAVDLSPITTTVIDGASGLASALDAKLIILHVMEPVAAYVPVGAAMDVITAPVPLEPPDLSAVRDRLEQLAEPLRRTGLMVDTISTAALPSDEILGQATSREASTRRFCFRRFFHIRLLIFFILISLTLLQTFCNCRSDIVYDNSD